MDEEGSLTDPSTGEESSSDSSNEEGRDYDTFDALAAASAAANVSKNFSDLSASDLLRDDFILEQFLSAVSERLDGSSTPSGLAWRRGDICLAQFSQDGLWYPAEILQVREERPSCLVRYSYYGNEEEVPFEALAAAVKE